MTGAKALASNPGAKKVSAILDDDSDTFMRNDCRDDKWVVVELSQVAKISRIELAQHELYSSRIKDFEVRGRQSHPRTDNVETSKGLNSTAWRLLGKFTAEKAKGTQDFVVEGPLWVHYLLIRFVTHYGNEPVCALNGIAVYGKSAAEELEDHLAEGEAGLDIESTEFEKGERNADDTIRNSEGNGVMGSSGNNVGVEGSQGQQQAVMSGQTGGNIGNETLSAVPESVQAGKSDGNGSSSSISDNGQAPASEISVPQGGGKGNKSSTAGVNTSAKDSNGQISTDQKTKQTDSDKIESSLSSNSLSAANANASSPSDPESATNASTSAIATAPAPTGSVGYLLDSLESLPVPRSKSGGGVYDVLIQEIRAIKAQQRVTAKALEALQRNMTSVHGTLGRMNTEYDVSEAQLGARIDAIVLGHVARLEAEAAELRHALGSAAKREHAALSLLAMFGAVFVMSLHQFGTIWRVGKGLVFALALANGAVGVALHWQSVDIIINALKTLPILSSSS